MRQNRLLERETPTLNIADTKELIRIKPLLSEVIEQNEDENDEVAIAITNTTVVPDTILQRNTFVTQIRKPLDKKQCIMMCKKVKKLVHLFFS